MNNPNISLFIPCGCTRGDYHHSTDECSFCKGTGKLLSPAGRYLYELIEWHEAQAEWDERQHDKLMDDYGHDYD